MPRTLLLCFVHGFRGSDDTFHDFPSDLKKQVSSKLPDHNVESVVYPKLKENVMDIRKTHSEKPWPPHDRDVGVIPVAHSMGGFVAVDTLLLILNERIANGEEGSSMFPLIQSILTFDTPFNGLARSMFVYGAFSNYSKVSNVFNVMTALSAAPVALVTCKAWQLIALRTGTVGAIAAGGVAAYVHRKKIMEGLKSMRNLNKESVKDGYNQGIDTLSQGLAYINRGNVGRSFEYLSDHLTFVGALLKQQELSQRLDRIASLRGVGIHDFYISLGANGVWSGGYFVPERTFCAIPEKEHGAYNLFSRQVIKKVQDEVEAHISMFKLDKNEDYERMTQEACNLVVGWFNDETELYDDPKFATAPPPQEPVDQLVDTTDDSKEVPKSEIVSGVTGPRDSGTQQVGEYSEDDGEMSGESPVDIAAAACLVPLPDDDETAPQVANAKEAKKTTYIRHLMRVAQQAGIDIRSYMPSKIPGMPQMPSGSSLKSFIPSQMPSIPRPTVNLFGKTQQSGTEKDQLAETKEGEPVRKSGSGAESITTEQGAPQPPIERIVATELYSDPTIG
ncbi:hypothetical protein DL766_004747 [Monosporascus sp. MC13-8B]|uniref:DUF676 domain-containing protein n=1 Tax=Monosporascus cannonballus TaxID=155416 RepID=A0ABY0H1D8_9PEZI|nr:hypothetical protein DL762_006646 [Monosporascus cannonballus]RYO88479.1 hypothetical protein DL763_005978 [Monosporascus cannonballus]RYP30735.1 hypothetical protein DL766_004747 [Monosporascus sp. MC13-8B]